MTTLITHVAQFLATAGPLGYLPASGTIATACIGIPLVILVRRWRPTTSILWPLATTSLAILITFCALPAFPGLIDPSAIVIDEVIGTLWTFWRQPINKRSLIIGFLAFRFFDITKWGLVSLSEQLPGALGIVMDDVVAGLFANLSLWALL